MTSLLRSVSSVSTFSSHCFAAQLEVAGLIFTIMTVCTGSGSTADPSRPGTRRDSSSLARS